MSDESYMHGSGWRADLIRSVGRLTINRLVLGWKDSRLRTRWIYHEVEIGRYSLAFGKSVTPTQEPKR